MQLAVTTVEPWVKVTLLEQLLAVVLHGKLAPFTVNGNELLLPADTLATDGLMLVTRGKFEFVVRRSCTFCR